MKSFLQALILIASIPVFGQSLDNNWWSVNGEVNDILTSSENVFLGGSFSYIGPITGPCSVIDLATGDLITGLPRPNGEIYTMISDGAGGLFIGGNFSTVEGELIQNIAHINSDYSLDTSWNPNPDGAVWAMELADGMLYIGGEFNNVDNKSLSKVARLDASLGFAYSQTDWGPGIISNDVYAIHIKDNHLYIGGEFITINSQPVRRLAQLSLSNGWLNSLWNPNPSAIVYAITTNDEFIFVGGTFSTIDGKTQRLLAKLEIADHSLETAWTQNLNFGSIRALAISGSDLYAGGNYSIVGSFGNQSMMKINAETGVVDTGWDPDLNSSALIKAILLDGSDIFIAGSSITSSHSQEVNNIVRLSSSDGDLSDPSWSPEPNDEVNSIVKNGSSMFVGGLYDQIGGFFTDNIAKIDITTGHGDPNFKIDMDGLVESLILDGSDLFAGGTFTTVNGDGVNRSKIVKISALDASLDPWETSMGSSGSVNKIVRKNDSIYFGGTSITLAGGQFVDNIGRISLTSGLADAAWKPEVSGAVLDLEIDGSNVVIAGAFSDVFNDGLTTGISYLAKLSTVDDNVDVSWNPEANDDINTVKIYNGNLYVGGKFTRINSLDKNLLAKLDLSSGAIDASWGPQLNTSINDEINDIEINNAEVYIGGSFENFGAQVQLDLARLYGSDGSFDNTWRPSVLGNRINALSYLFSDGIVSGGSIAEVNSIISGGLFHIDNPIPLPVDLLYFQAKIKDDLVYLTWATSSEISNQGFEVQRSFDGYKFENIGFVGGAGTTSATSKYQFYANRSLSRTFYRLKQVDYDGYFEYSNIISVEGSDIQRIIYPNPTSGVLKLNGFKSLTLYNSEGVLLMRMPNLSNNDVLDISHLPVGVYWISSESNGRSSMRKIVKK